MPNPKAAIAATIAPLIAAALLATSACGTGVTAEPPTAQPTTTGSQPGQPTEPSETAEPGVARIGQWAVADDGVRFRVSSLKRTKVGALAAGGRPGDPAVIAVVEIDNGSTRRLDLDEVTVLARVGSDGTEAESVYQEGIDGFSGSLPPGRKAKDNYMFAATTPRDLTKVAVEVTPSWDHNPYTFEGAATK